jgi:putative sigma-54 modulation protein
MQIKITARHLKLTDAINDYARKKVEKAQHYFSNVVNAQVILSVDKYRQVAEVILHTGRTGSKSIFRAKDVSEDLYAAIDLAMDKIDKQLKKIKEMSKLHRKDNLKAAALRKIEELSESVPEKIDVTETKRVDVKLESLQDAARQLIASGDNFHMFLNTESSQINVLYRKSDGTIGLLEPEI